jgi:GxxExxY protein
MANPLLHADLTFHLRGAAFQVHNALKGGHAEQVYEEAFCIALDRTGIPYRRQPQIQLHYKGRQVGEYYPDLMLADDKVLLEFKAVPTIQPLHKAQVLSYLAATQAELGLVFNFGAPSMQIARLPNFVGNRQPFAWTSTAPPDLRFADVTDRVSAALHEVHYELGPGFLHQVYRRAARMELSLRSLNFEYLKDLPLRFEMQSIGTSPTRLLMVERCVLVAVVAVFEITPRHTERLRWAMRETTCQLGLLANFYTGKLQVIYLSASA